MRNVPDEEKGTAAGAQLGLWIMFVFMGLLVLAAILGSFIVGPLMLLLILVAAAVAGTMALSRRLKQR
jgi:hypothetical protein